MFYAKIPSQDFMCLSNIQFRYQAVPIINFWLSAERILNSDLLDGKVELSIVAWATGRDKIIWMSFSTQHPWRDMVGNGIEDMDNPVCEYVFGMPTKGLNI